MDDTDAAPADLIPILVGETRYFWRHNHCYVYVSNEDEELLFSINTTKPTADLVFACIEAFFDGRSLGHQRGYLEKAAELRRALGIVG